MKPILLDTVLAQTYEEFSIPADQFIGNSELTQEFASRVRDLVGDVNMESQAIMRRLVNLRKKGKLPRLRRSCSGRNASDS